MKQILGEIKLIIFWAYDFFPTHNISEILGKLKLFLSGASKKEIRHFEKIMNFPLLESVALQKKCDYSFGDQSGVLGRVPGAFMKKANIDNKEFVQKVKEHRKKIMTLFIDNIRLYKRPLEFSDWLHMRPISPPDRKWLNTMMDEDLLNLCNEFPNKKFIIFTALEDTPLDSYIKIPKNVLAINAANAVYFGGKIIPYPHGLERKMHWGYNHHAIMHKFLLDNSLPNKLLYVNCRLDTGDRKKLYPLFSNKSWTTVSPRTDYETYLRGIKNHKFVLCPSGNGIESARNWETLYMRRVPVFKDHPYLREVFKGFPALFVSDFKKVTEKLLLKNDHLYKKALKTNFDKLNLDKLFKKRVKYHNGL